MFESFVKRMNDMTSVELSSWLVNGLIGVRHARAPAVAFAHAGGSFGQTSPEWRATDELAALFGLLDPMAKRRFHEGVGRSIEELEATQSNAAVLRDLAELGLLTHCNLAVGVLAAKIRLPSPEVRSVVYDLCGFYLAERDAPEGVKELALQILRNADFPESLCLQLLVAVARYSTEGMLTYAGPLVPGLQHLLLSKEHWPRGYHRFQRDFAEAVLRGQAVDTVLNRLLGHPVYAALLLPFLESVGPGTARAKLEPPLPETFRVSPSGLASSARAHLFPQSTRTVKDSRTLIEA